MELSKSTAACTDSLTTSPILSAPQAAPAIAAAFLATEPRFVMRPSAVAMAFLKEPDTEPAIRTASSYSLLVLANGISRLLCYFGEFLNGQTQKEVHACPQGHGEVDASLTQLLSVAGT